MNIPSSSFMIFSFIQDIFGPCDNVLPKDYHKYTTNRHPNPSQPQPKFPNRPSQPKIRDGSGMSY